MNDDDSNRQVLALFVNIRINNVNSVDSKANFWAVPTAGEINGDLSIHFL